MSGHHRVKNIEYNDDEDDLYPEDEDGYGDEGEGGGEQAYTAEDRENFSTLTPVVRAELEEAGVRDASTAEIEEALWHYYWDVGKSVAYLKNIKGASSKKKKAQQQTEGMETKKAKAKPKSKFDEAAERSALKSGGASKSTANGLAKKTEALKLEPTTPTPAPPKIRSKGLDVPRLWAEQKSKRKASAAFVVIGHVDHGKSTLMGRLLLDTGAVAQRDVDKFKKQAQEIGKSSFALAWVMDTGSDERERGVTVDIAQHHFSTDDVDFTILDAPGHRDFVPNMIGGTSMADLAVLVVDVNQLGSGMKGQTREHILLAQAVGLRKFVVAVNKLDATNPPWSKNAFDEVRAEVSKYFEEIGIPDKDVSFVPCSGLSGASVVKPASKQGAGESWVAEYNTLLQELENTTPHDAATDEQIRRPLRMQIADVFRAGIQNPLSVSGRIMQGSVQIGDTAVMQPSGETALIKGVEVGGDTREWAVAGQLCTLHLTDIDAQHLRAGDVLCSQNQPVPVVKSFRVRAHASEGILPQGVDVHVGRLHASANITQLLATVDRDDQVVKKKPRMVKAGQMADLKVVLDNELPLDAGTRIVLRSNGTTIAAGSVLDSTGGGRSQ